jgi:type III restriction enzyme
VQLFELKSFQLKAATLISQRYVYFANHPYRPKKGNKPRPFFQALSALTGAGKTPILAYAVALMRAHFAVEPIVFWTSKAKSVVAQTYNNFNAGGKYHEILDDFAVINVSELTPSLISDGNAPLLILGTTGLFNNKNQSEGTLNIYSEDQDQFGGQSPWQRLVDRTFEGKRRPLILVYDEGHNLSPQQTEILSELEPDAYLLASATLKLPETFERSVIRHIGTWIDDCQAEKAEFDLLKALDDTQCPELGRFITTAISSAEVVTAELVKNAIQFDGTTAPMEPCIDELVARLGLI